jgi:alkyl sulfatase BDS1-like metallo-beta-lactamase superfamily hydrolase
VLNIVLSDTSEKHLITIENAVLIHEAGVHDHKADATVSMKRSDLMETLLAGVPIGIKRATGVIKIEGKPDAYSELVALIDPINTNFNIVTP